MVVLGRILSMYVAISQVLVARTQMEVVLMAMTMLLALIHGKYGAPDDLPL